MNPEKHELLHRHFQRGELVILNEGGVMSPWYFGGYAHSGVRLHHNCFNGIYTETRLVHYGRFDLERPNTDEAAVRAALLSAGATALEAGSRKGVPTNYPVDCRDEGF